MHVYLVERHGTTGDVEVDRKVKGWLVGKALLGESRHPRPHTNDSTAQEEEKEDVDGAEQCKHPILHFYDGASLLAASPLPICTRRECVVAIHARIAPVKVIRDNRRRMRL